MAIILIGYLAVVSFKTSCKAVTTTGENVLRVLKGTLVLKARGSSNIVGLDIFRLLNLEVIDGKKTFAEDGIHLPFTKDSSVYFGHGKIYKRKTKINIKF